METHSCPKEDVETPLNNDNNKTSPPPKVSGFHENNKKGKQYSSKNILYCC